MKLVDISKVKETLNDEEKEIFDIVCKAINKPNIPAKILNIAFVIVLLYTCFTFLPLWAAATLIGIKLMLPITEVTKYIVAAKSLLKDHKTLIKLFYKLDLRLPGLKMSEK